MWYRVASCRPTYVTSSKLRLHASRRPQTATSRPPPCRRRRRQRPRRRRRYRRVQSLHHRGRATLPQSQTVACQHRHQVSGYCVQNLQIHLHSTHSVCPRDFVHTISVTETFNSTQVKSSLLTNGRRMVKRNTADKNKSNDQSE